MKSILLLIEQQKNRHLLSQWLANQYHILCPKTQAEFTTAGEQLLEQSFDLCFVDSTAIRQLREQMLARREAESPLFLPFVFLTSLKDIGFSTDHLEPLIDNIVYIPIKKIELQTQLRVLLRSRSYSLQLQTAQAELNQALFQEKELNQLKSQFVSIVSHEFRNPLNSISGMAQILKSLDHNLSPAKKAEVLERLQYNVTKMTHLLDDVLDLSRQDLGKLQFDPTPLELTTFCQDLINEVQTVFNHKQQINLVYQGEQPQKFNLDGKLLHHILTNLLSNACKYSPQDSVIDFEVCPQVSEIMFLICDRGIGIPAEDIPYLFDSFYRGSNSQNFQGTGLGLAIVKQYVELYQGAIAVESQLDVGTKFKVTIPVS
jgi:signal transduction histidine kinase